MGHAEINDGSVIYPHCITTISNSELLESIVRCEGSRIRGVGGEEARGMIQENVPM